MRVGAVLFDLDGTLFDTKRLYLECYRRALGPVLGRELTDAEILALRPRSEARFLLGRLAAEPRGEAQREACFRRFYEAYERLHAEYFDGVYDGVAELTAALRARRVRVGIVSGKSRRSWAITLAHLSLGGFDTTVLDDDVAEPKPHPEGLERALATLGVAPAAAAYVGDTMGDIAAARAAGVTPVAAVWARRDPARAADFERRAAAAGAVVARRPADVLELSVAGLPDVDDQPGRLTQRESPIV